MLVSSHLMSELQDTADHLVVIGRGKLIADTSVADLIAAASGDRVELRTTKRAEAMTVLANAGAHRRRHRPESLDRRGLPASGSPRCSAERRPAVLRTRPHRASLEEAYMELTRDAVEFTAPQVQDA